MAQQVNGRVALDAPHKVVKASQASISKEVPINLSSRQGIVCPTSPVLPESYVAFCNLVSAHMCVEPVGSLTVG